VNVRPATLEDAAAVAAVFSAVEIAIQGRSSFDEDSVLGWWQTTSLETNTWLFEDEGRIVAAAGGELHADRGNWAGSVHPEAQGRGIGAQLLSLAEARLAEEGAKRLHSWTVAGDVRADELFAAHGYNEVRRFWDMAIELSDEPPAAPPVAVSGFEADDAVSFHAALEEAFADHWEPHPEPFETWWARQQGRRNFDTSLWFLIRDGDEVAAICRNEARADGGYIGALGVRRPWRGKGYGKALLLQSFREFHRRGHRRVTLGVDAANPTGATQLYRGVGMHAEQEFVVYEKLLA
jgi:GNAT superfamily N-acetyltransferase